jgi:TolB-like protein
LKRRFLCIAFFFFFWSVYGQSGIVSFDEAIQNSAVQIQDGLDKNATVIVYQFQSQYPGLSDYVLKELFHKLVNSRKFIVLDRTAHEVINAELDFQFNKSAGMISDESLASLTKRIGAQAIITGSLDEAGNEYRFRIRVIGTETTAAIASYVAKKQKNDRRVTALRTKPPKTAGQKIGAGVLNILLGLGSYIEGDAAGGVTLSAGYAVSAGLFVIEAVALDRDSPAAGVPATIGAAVAGVTMVYGFARPFIYNYSPKTAAVLDAAKPEIIFTSDSYGNRVGFQVSYTVKF